MIDATIRSVGRSGVGPRASDRSVAGATGTDGSLDEVEFLFDSGGEPVAARVGRHLVDLAGRWLGWVPWADGDAFDAEGRYLGTITPDGRLYDIAARHGLASPPPVAPPPIVPTPPPDRRRPEPPGPGRRDARLRPVLRSVEPLTGPASGSPRAAAHEAGGR